MIVLNWRTPELAERCVGSVLASQFDGSLVPIVVDNNSRDGSVDRLRSCFGNQVELIESEENCGYAGGMNIGLARAAELNARYALLLNADVELELDSIYELYRVAEGNPGGGLFGPRIFDVGKPSDRWLVGGRWDWWQGTIRILRERAVDGLSNEPRRIEFVNGAAMFARMSVFERVGAFDERFGLYFEESDLCSRAKNVRYTLWHVPRASVWHVCSASISKALEGTRFDIGQYYRTRNRLLWGRKNLTGLRAAAFWLNIVLRWPLKVSAFLLSGRVSKARGLIEGVYDFFRGHYGMITTRS